MIRDDVYPLPSCHQELTLNLRIVVSVKGLIEQCLDVCMRRWTFDLQQAVIANQAVRTGTHRSGIIGAEPYRNRFDIALKLVKRSCIWLKLVASLSPSVSLEGLDRLTDHNLGEKTVGVCTGLLRCLTPSGDDLVEL